MTVRTALGDLEHAAFLPTDPDLDGYVILDFRAFDAWYDLIWTCRQPLHEAPPVRDLPVFYNERVDIFVDGVRHERPVTIFSSNA
jgi:hypothetical protein